MDNQATVFIVDDDQALAESMRWLIESVGLHVETFNSADAFLDQYDSERPGCLVLDVRMPGIDGLALQERLVRQRVDIPIIFMTGHGDVPMAIRAMKAGAIEFLPKPFDDQVLLDSIHHAMALDEKRRAKRQRSDTISSRVQRLTPREKEVMKLVVAGKLNKVLAGELGISPKTVEMHRAKIMEKMEVNSLAELVAAVLYQTETTV